MRFYPPDQLPPMAQPEAPDDPACASRLRAARRLILLGALLLGLIAGFVGYWRYGAASCFVAVPLALLLGRHCAANHRSPSRVAARGPWPILW